MADATPKPLWVLLPVKNFARAKSRLSPVLSDGERAAFAQNLCEHVLDTLGRCDAIDGTLLLSDSDDVMRLVQRPGQHAERERSGPYTGPLLSAIIDDGLSRLVERGARAAIVLMSDLPRIEVAELLRLVELLREHDCVIAPDLREQNTNALALRLGLAHPLRTAFGSGDSFARHVELARAAGLRTAVHRSFGLGFDVDLPADYADLPDSGAFPRRS